MMKCKICDNSDTLKEYKVREMMFGFRDEFSYFECGECGCLQIAKIPDNISKYYPSNYYSYNTPSPYAKSDINRFFKRKRDNYTIFGKGVLGKLIFKISPDTLLQFLSEVPVKKDDRILDVGCGRGSLLLTLKEIGFHNIFGIEPYLPGDISYENGLRIYKKTIHEVEENVDLIMFHHSFEHMPDPLETLQIVSKLLNKGGYCIIRIPTVSSYAWSHYRENWVQLDAPRHFFLHSKKSIDLLAQKASLSVEKIIYDSTALQFLGSERYVRDIPLRDPIKNEEIFSQSEIEGYKRRAIELNNQGNGDACAFILKKIE